MLEPANSNQIEKRYSLVGVLEDIFSNNDDLSFGVTEGEGKSVLSQKTIMSGIRSTEYAPFLMQQISQENIHPFTLQICILAAYDYGFKVHVLRTMEWQNKEENFLDDGYTKILSSLLCFLVGFREVLMGGIAKATNFGSGDLFAIDAIGMLRLKIPFTGSVEPDDTGFIAKCLEMPQVFGFGDTRHEAIGNLQKEMISMHNDLMEGVDFSQEFQVLKGCLALAVPNA